MENKEEMTRIGLRVSNDLLARFDAIAKKKSVTRNSLFCMAIAEYCNMQEKQESILSEENVKALLFSLAAQKSDMTK